MWVSHLTQLLDSVLRTPKAFRHPEDHPAVGGLRVFTGVLERLSGR